MSESSLIIFILHVALEREYEQLEKLAVAYDGDHSLGNIEDISDVCPLE